MIPTEKHPGLDDFYKRATGKDRVETIKSDACVMCPETNVTFKDYLSVREYRISGMCQKCQDKVWG